MSESVMEIDKFGNKHWRNSKGDLHRIGGPAVEWRDGDKDWYQNGQYHRTDGPAIEYQNGDITTWFVNGKFLGFDDKGFWALWDRLTLEQKKDPVLLSYLPEKF
jgi:hypothetical protein